MMPAMPAPLAWIIIIWQNFLLHSLELLHLSGQCMHPRPCPGAAWALVGKSSHLHNAAVTELISCALPAKQWVTVLRLGGGRLVSVCSVHSLS